MIARVSRGSTRAEDATAHAEHMGGTGGRALADTPGSRGVYMLRRVVGDTAEFVMLSLWESEDADPRVRRRGHLRGRLLPRRRSVPDRP